MKHLVLIHIQQSYNIQTKTDFRSDFPHIFETENCLSLNMLPLSRKLKLQVSSVTDFYLEARHRCVFDR